MSHQFGKTILLGFLVIAAIVVSSVSYAATATDWTPSSLTQTIVRGESKTVTVTLNAIQDLGDINLRVDPKLVAFVSVEPTTISRVVAGSRTQIIIRLSAAVNAPIGIFQGTIQVKSGSFNMKVLPKPLPVTITIGESSALGQDVNNDKIWDDVEDFINRNYSTSPETVAALRQLAVATQNALLRADDKAASINNQVEIMRAFTCLEYRRPSDLGDVASQLEAAIINTIARHQAYSLFSDQLAGTITKGWPTGKESAACQQ